MKTKILIIINIFLISLLLITTFYKENITSYLLKSKNKTTAIEYETIKFNENKVIDIKTDKIYDNKYEAQILNKEDNDYYKIIDVTVANNKGWLVVVYDPSTVRIMKSHAFKTANNSGKDNILDMTKNYNAIIGVNGGGFYDDGVVSKDIPFGYIIENGKIIYQSHNHKSDLIGMSNDNKLMLIHATGEEAIKQGMRDALEFGPFLIQDGVRKTNLKVSYASRNIIAQRKDGIILFLVTEGASYRGITFDDCIDFLLKYDVVNAANLDGGASTQLVVKNKLLNNPKNAYGIPIKNGRTVVNGWGVILPS